MNSVVLMNPYEKIRAGVHPGESAQRQWPWVNLADLTVATTALASGQRNSTYVASLGSTKMAVYSPKNGQVALEVRARSDGNDGDDNIVEMYAAADDIVADFFHYRRLATLTFTRGTGEYWPTAVDPNPATIFFADELAASNIDWLSDTNDVGVDASNDYSTWIVNCHGYSKFAFVFSTKDANTTHLYLDVRRF